MLSFGIRIPSQSCSDPGRFLARCVAKMTCWSNPSLLDNPFRVHRRCAATTDIVEIQPQQSTVLRVDRGETCCVNIRYTSTKCVPGGRSLPLSEARIKADDEYHMQNIAIEWASPGPNRAALGEFALVRVRVLPWPRLVPKHGHYLTALCKLQRDEHFHMIADTA